ncbi:hypothetical protein [Paraburkholderia susongensis]|uniref:hypothetical protein n=1 Tax=Paraburkholderia susongensis TaxID=1515439 RepID=UPI000A1CE00F|nr:hypothetical protein [Paraburkholderia susongensis]
MQRQAIETLRQLLEQVPVIEHLDVRPQRSNAAVDIVAQAEVMGKSYTLVCEVKSSGQPRHALLALLQLRDELVRRKGEATPVFIAPYLSPEVQALCREQGAGFLDFEGNAHLVFGSVFIERQVASKPFALFVGLCARFASNIQRDQCRWFCCRQRAAFCTR